LSFVIIKNKGEYFSKQQQLNIHNCAGMICTLAESNFNERAPDEMRLLIVASKTTPALHNEDQIVIV
jgi:hypothetical protein